MGFLAEIKTRNICEINLSDLANQRMKAASRWPWADICTLAKPRRIYISGVLEVMWWFYIYRKKRYVKVLT